MSPHEKFGFGIQAFGLGIRVECESAETRQMLNKYLLPPMGRYDMPADSALINLQVLEEQGGLSISINAQQVATAINARDAVLASVKALDDAVVKNLKLYRAIHAGAVTLNGRALLIPGSTHAGKSSLVAQLLRNGANLLSDEYALIDNRGCVHAYPRPMLLRNGSHKQSPVLPEELNANFAEGPANVGWILALHYDPQAGWHVEEISQGEAVILLLSNTPHEMEQSPEMISHFSCMSADAACYSGTRGDFTEATERILELVACK
jgi:hypothetical protein